MKLLLINPKFPESFWSFKWAVDKILPDKRTVNPPLGLATLAALSPADWEIEIIDENIESVPLQPQADLIGVCGMGVQFPRQQELLTFYRNMGYYVVAGGSYASLCPENYADLADTVIAGEAEYIWKAFCEDFMAGHQAKLYHETSEVDMHDSPTPRFDLLKLDKYSSISLQFSRGCPYRCEFCDIIVMFGRKPRTKSTEQIGRELDALRALNVHTAFFVDDNLIGNKPLAKELMRYLIDYQQQHDYTFHFGTEASINLAQDKELLGLCRSANFNWVFIGIESPDEASLRETNKLQNTRDDLLTSVRQIYAHGIEILAGFIVGFDNDTRETFDRQFEFITKSGIQAAMIGLLTALPKTPLYERLQKEGRLITGVNSADNTKLGSNIIPKQMTYQELVDGYQQLYNRLLTSKSIAARIKNKIKFLRIPSYSGGQSLREQLHMVRNLLHHAVFNKRPSHVFHFLRSLPIFSPRLLPVVLKDWVIGLTMRDYVDRHFNIKLHSSNAKAEGYFKRLEAAFQRYLYKGSLEISLVPVKNAAAELSVSINGLLDRPFFRQASRHFEKVLKNTAASITLHIEDFNEQQIRYLNKMLRRLSRYGDRVSIAVNENIRHLIQIDSSVFNLVLVPARA